MSLPSFTSNTHYHDLQFIIQCSHPLGWTWEQGHAWHQSQLCKLCAKSIENKCKIILHDIFSSSPPWPGLLVVTAVFLVILFGAFDISLFSLLLLFPTLFAHFARILQTSKKEQKPLCLVCMLHRSASLTAKNFFVRWKVQSRLSRVIF